MELLEAPGTVEPPLDNGAGEPARLMLVGAPAAVRDTVMRWASDVGAAVSVVPDRLRALRLLATQRCDAVIAPFTSDAEPELDAWRASLATFPDPPRLVALVDCPSVELVLDAATDPRIEILPRRPSRQHLCEAIAGSRRVRDEESVRLLPPAPEDRSHSGLVGQSAPMLEVFKLLVKVAPGLATVLIEGESGTGKEVVARFIHTHGPCASGPFIAVNCAAIPENLLESELFGHERGAFTGAVARVLGKVELADGGTLFLDEVAELHAGLQAKLLRVMQERTFERVGGRETIRAHVRVVAATNRNVDAEVAAGRLREDLYYRLAVVRVQLPRLIDRGDDLLLLISHFAQRYGALYGKSIRRLSTRALELLHAHRWKGNVRELENVIERAVIYSRDEMLRDTDLPDEVRMPSIPANGIPKNLTLAEIERRHIAHVLELAHGQVGRAAAILGVHRNTLARKLRAHWL